MDGIDPRLREPQPQAQLYHHQLQRSGPPPNIPIAANPLRLPLPPPQLYHHSHDTTLPSIYNAPSHQAHTTPPYSGPPPVAHDANHPHESPQHGSPSDPNNDPKRPRACEACRGLKVRCEPLPDNSDGPCKRCTKANRNCVVTVPSRKRQKKTDSRVAELEKKIDALTASLQATKNGGAVHDGDHEGRPNPYEQVTNGAYGYSSGRPSTATASEEWMTPGRYAKTPTAEHMRSAAPPMVMAGQKRKHHEQSKSEGNTPAGNADSPYLKREREDSPAKHDQSSNEYADVVDRGVISMEAATSTFNHYVLDMAPHLPAVVFPEGTTAAEIRKTKPILFLAILSAASGLTQPDIQRILTKEVMQIFADRIICQGEKSLEIVQALTICCLWYWPPEHFEELKFYQLIHIAAVMAIDIGLGRKAKPGGVKAKFSGLWRDHPWRRTPFPDSNTAESRRAWLSLYFLCCNSSMGLRRPNLIRWNAYMGDCVDFLENSPEAAPTDKLLCQWVRSQHLAEEVGTQFSMDDPFASVSISEPKVQFALKGFENDLQHWREQIPEDVKCPSLTMTEHVVGLYMHEVAMHVDHNVEEFKPPFTSALGGETNKKPLDSLTPAHISALSTCLSSIDGILETFLSLEISTIRTLPIFHFVRVAYAVVVLIKMYFAAAAPSGELGKVIDKDNMKVEIYLDDLLEKFKEAATGDKSRPSAKFMMVLVMLKTWFHRQRENRRHSLLKGHERNGSTFSVTTRDGGTPLPTPGQEKDRQLVQQQQQQPTPNQGAQEYTTPNTPLQLLSEVATGGNGQGGSRMSTYPTPSATSTADWASQSATPHMSSGPMQAPYPSQAYGETHVLAGNAHQHAGIYGNMGPAPMQGHDGLPLPQDMMAMNVGPMGLEYTMGDGFEQAMGITMGDGSYFGKYLSDDAFFGAMMDSMGGGPGPFFEGF